MIVVKRQCCSSFLSTHLDTDIVNVKQVDVVGNNLESTHGFCCQRNEVFVECFAHKGECTACPQVTFNDLNIIADCHELNVEGTGDVEGLGNGHGVFLDLTNGLDVEFLGWENDCGIATVDTGIFQVLPNGVI